jgi:Family of unknown function (DUF5908)
MPIEIRELVIRAVVTAGADPQAAEQAEPNELASSAASALPPTPSASAEREALVQACVQQVLRILKKLKER